MNKLVGLLLCLGFFGLVGTFGVASGVLFAGAAVGLVVVLAVLAVRFLTARLD
jgi:hypothetical protein